MPADHTARSATRDRLTRIAEHLEKRKVAVVPLDPEFVRELYDRMRAMAEEILSTCESVPDIPPDKE